MNLVIKPAKSLRGIITLPGDKSISHRAAMLAAVAHGETIIENFSLSLDCQRTITCLEKLGVKCEQLEHTLRIQGRGWEGLSSPAEILDCGNSGTTLRLLPGLLAGTNVTATLDGDASLRKRPIQRIVEPLSRMGARVISQNGSCPVTVSGGLLQGIEYCLPVASAQVKSAVLLAGLRAPGRTSVIEEMPTRDHTERMLDFLGVTVQVTWPEAEPRTETIDFRKRRKPLVKKITVQYVDQIQAKNLVIPGDISGAAFFIAAACLVRRTELSLHNVGLNPTRNGLLAVLRQMGASISVERKGEMSNEPFGSITARTSDLSARKISGAIIPGVIDELPLLALLATQCNGTTIIRDAGELRLKESDRIHSVAENLRRMGARIGELEDGWIIEGKTELSGNTLDSFGDHRIAMTFAIAGLIAHGYTVLKDAECVNVSFPGFFELLESIRR